MANEYYVVFDKGKDQWEIQIPENEYSGSGSFVVETFDTKSQAMERARELGRNQNARIVENARKGYTMNHIDYS